MEPEISSPISPSTSSDDESVIMYARGVASAALDKKAEDIVIIDLRGLTNYTDFLVIVTGRSTRQVEAIVESVITYIKKDAGSQVLGVEGLPEARWALVDWGDIVCHVFLDETRTFYDIEGMWMDAPRIDPPEFGV